MNELSQEKSPYLQQHAGNPVHWKAWGEKAFKLARTQDKPIFLSIGYSTCHWCHVMERESFERKEIADYLNANFISIKVDREELPEVDALYMEALHIMNSRGGWPLNVFLDNDLRPFFGGTYFPAQNFFQLLHQLKSMWSEKRDQILQVTEEIKHYLSQDDEKVRGLNLSQLPRDFTKSSTERFDLAHGGHQGAPKFPMNYEAIALVRFNYNEENAALDNTKFYLEKMLSGGIWDHVGGGLHRYSTDDEWRVPHFEKMLYDQASTLGVITEVLMKEEDPFLRKRAESLIDYLIRDLKIPGGAFYAAEDADSEGVEGKFYVWTYHELESVLSNEEFDKLKNHFEIQEEGNWEHNIVIHAAEMEKGDYSEIWKKLLEVRSKRHRPTRDEKVITAWNGLMIASLARYARTQENSRVTNLAKEAADFVLENLYANKTLLRRWIAGEAKFTAQLEDYAFLIEGLRELYLSSMELKYLKCAIELQDLALAIFWKEGKGFISNTGENVWRDNQEFNDNVTPSAVSTSLLNLLWLSELALKDDYAAKVQSIIADIPKGVLQYPLIYPRLIEFYKLQSSGLESVVAILKNAASSTKAPLLKSYAPNRFMITGTESEHPLLNGKKAVFDNLTYYICKNKTCSAPSDKP